jgi:hypothetical protein
MSDTPRTHKASRLRGSLFFVETVVSESLERELNAANADLAQRTAERDEARREYCVSQAIVLLHEANPNALISYGECRRIEREIAADRGWNCFDAPHATDGRVQNGGA